MPELVEQMPWLLAMLVLILGSGFFSASEAALFYLQPADRQAMLKGSTTQRLAARLLDDPDKLLSSVLFWNLVINMAYFAISSIVSFRLEAAGPSLGILFGVASLLAIIFFSEMMPKSIAVISPKLCSSLASVPLAVAIKIVSPVMPVLRFVNVMSQRLVWPTFTPEPYLEVSDLERAIELSVTDAQLIDQEQAVLQNIVSLGEIRADEWMRPRSQFKVFRVPASLADLEGKMTPSGYLLLLEESENDDVTSAINLRTLTDVPTDHLERLATPVVYVPWCAAVADVLEKMVHKQREVAAVVNEFGETIGIVTYEDLLDTIFNYDPARAGGFGHQRKIDHTGENTWQVTGGVGLRRLSRELGVELPSVRSVTVAGAIQEALERLAESGDTGTWGKLAFHVLRAPRRGEMLIELRLLSTEEEVS